MKRLGLLLALLPAAVPAQAPSPAGSTAPAPKPIPGVSPAGMAIIDKYRGPNDPQLGQLVRQQRSIHQQVIAATLATRIDPDRMTTLLRQEETAAAAVRTHLNDQMMAALRELSEPDRAPFLRAFIKPTAPAPTPAR
jgi:hypothetical protein